MLKFNPSYVDILRRAALVLSLTSQTSLIETEAEAAAKRQRLRRIGLRLFGGGILCFLAALLLKSEVMSYLAAIPLLLARCYQLVADTVRSTASNER
jgi:hypothetical protein